MSRKKLIITAIILVLVLAIGGILAYFTDVQTKTNKFKMGTVEIEVTEPSWPGDENTPVDIVPEQEIAKDPTVTNKGDGEVYAFAEVTIPCETVKIGDATTATLTELFTLLHNVTDDTTGEVTKESGINPAWAQVGTKTAVYDETDDTKIVGYTYVYAYGTATKLTGLTKNESTPPVFDYVKFADVTEDSATTNSIQGSNFEVVVSGYGIQADGLESDDPATVWALVK